MCGATRHVRYGPKADIAACSHSMISSARTRIDCGIVSPSFFHIDDKLETHRLLDRKRVGRCALDDLVHVMRGAPIDDSEIWPIGDQPAGCREVFVDRYHGQSVPRRQVDNFLAVFGDRSIIHDKERFSAKVVTKSICLSAKGRTTL